MKSELAEEFQLWLKSICHSPTSSMAKSLEEAFLAGSEANERVKDGINKKLINGIVEGESTNDMGLIFLEMDTGEFLSKFIESTKEMYVEYCGLQAFDQGLLSYAEPDYKQAIDFARDLIRRMINTGEL